jgi:hypothetical protein
VKDFTEARYPRDGEIITQMPDIPSAIFNENSAVDSIYGLKFSRQTLKFAIF